LSEAVGGRVRDRIRLYGSAGMYMPPVKYAEEAAAVADLGFRAYKMRPALGPDEDLETVRLMRKAVGPDFDLMVDAHTWWRMGDRSYDFPAVAHVCICWQEMVVQWLEYPCYSNEVRAGMYPFPLAEEVFKEPLEISHGDLIVPRKPGLGIEINESVIDRYPWIPGPSSSFRI